MEKRCSYLLDRLAGMPYAAPFSFQKNTTVGIGGEAPLALYPESEDRLTAVLGVLSETHIPYVMLGRGSNVLVSDSGFSGVVVSTSRVGLIRTRGEILYAECGAGLEKVLAVAKRNGLGGISFLCGIPASVGGALYMNAGVKSGYIGDRVHSVTVFSAGEKKEFTAEECGFSYKHTRFMEEPCVILSARLRLVRYSAEKSEAEYAEYKRARGHLPKGRSMGCVFKNPQGFSAGLLLERAGMKGESCGGAVVSDKHANFIINRGGATAQDVVSLIKRMKNRVFSETGIELMEEIRYIGDF